MIPFILAAIGGAIIGNAIQSDIDKLSEGGVIVNKDGVGTDASDGGIFKGKRHSEGGIAVDVIGGNPVEVETDEALIKNGEANSTETVSFDGKQMTPREVLSKINQDYGGVPIKKQGGMLDIDTKVKQASKSGKPVVVEGGSIVITRNAILDEKTKHNFNGKMLTNKEILSEVNKMNGGVAFAKGGNIYSDGTEIPSDMYTILKEKSAYDKNVDELSEKINKLAKENPSDLGAGLVSDELRNSKKWIDLKRDYNKAVENKKKFLSSEDGKKYMNYYKKLDRMKRMELLKIA